MKLRGDAAFRTLALYLHIQSVTLHRAVNRMCTLLVDLPLCQDAAHQFLIVDGTCTRVRSTDRVNDSGYKHDENLKIE